MENQHTFMFADIEIAHSLLNSKRLDKRRPDELRSVKLSKANLQNCQGSVKCQMGDTLIYAGATVKVLPQRTGSEDQHYVVNDAKVPQGLLVCNVVLSALSGNHIENFTRIGTGPPNLPSQAASHWLQQTLEASVDLRRLAIFSTDNNESDFPNDENDMVSQNKSLPVAIYCVEVDVVCVHTDGSLWDACLLAAVGALRNCSWPQISAEHVTSRMSTHSMDSCSNSQTTVHIPFLHLPISLTSVPLPKQMSTTHRLMNPTFLEERVSSGSMTCVYAFPLNKNHDVDHPAHLLSVYKMGGSPIGVKEMEKIIHFKSALVSVWMHSVLDLH